MSIPRSKHNHGSADDPRATWIAMADHFLDTETRHELPRTALIAVRDGLSVARAERVWFDEVSPAVDYNIHEIAGEWALWDEDWLLRTIRRKRWVRRWLPRLAHALRRAPGSYHATMWSGIGGCMELIEARPEAERGAYARDLGWLAAHYFDMRARTTPTARLAELRRIFADELEPVLRRLVVRAGQPWPEDQALCAGRVHAAFDELGDPWRTEP